MSAILYKETKGQASCSRGKEGFVERGSRKKNIPLLKVEVFFIQISNVTFSAVLPSRYT